MGSLWAFIVAIAAGIIGDLFLTKSKNSSLEQKLAAGKYENEDSNLEAKQTQLAIQASQEEKQVSESKEPTSAPALTPEQVTNYWNNKK